jgi:hypothetical protein
MSTCVCDFDSFSGRSRFFFSSEFCFKNDTRSCDLASCLSLFVALPAARIERSLRCCTQDMLFVFVNDSYIYLFTVLAANRDHILV